MDLIRRYEDIDSVERDVMQSLGYEWKNNGWQLIDGTINEDTMITHACIEPIPNKAKNLGKSHILDTPTSEINKSTTKICEDDDRVQPFSEISKSEERRVKDTVVKYHKSLEENIHRKLENASRIKQHLEVEYNKSIDSLSPIEKSQHELNIVIKTLDEVKAKVALDIVKVNRIQAEYSKLWQEFWFLSIEQPTSSNRRQWREAHDVAERKLVEANPIKIQIEDHKKRLVQLQQDIENKKQSLANEIENEVIISDFYGIIIEKYGEESEKIAKKLADSIKGKKICNAEQAFEEFNKYIDSLNKNYSIDDREVVANALEALNMNKIAKNLTKFSIAFGFLSQPINVEEWINELSKAIRSNDWQEFFVKIKTLDDGIVATTISAFGFSIVFVGQLGLLGYGIIMAIVSAFVNEELWKKSIN